MTPARRQRMKEARTWYKEQNFTRNSHVVKAYRQRFSVDKTCAMRELVKLGLLPPGKQQMYKDQLMAREQKMAEKRERKRRRAEEADINPFQDYYQPGRKSLGKRYKLKLATGA